MTSGFRILLARHDVVEEFVDDLAPPDLHALVARLPATCTRTTLKQTI